jgi:hypothetical protein
MSTREIIGVSLFAVDLVPFRIRRLRGRLVNKQGTRRELRVT